jgi:phosphoglycolate phosphatase-like HAD superfamily hydrolase
MFSKSKTSGVWNGRKVEFGKVYGNPMATAFGKMQEVVGKKLRVFDFDDTLVQTKSHIYITHKDGKKSKLTPGEYAVYEPKSGDKFDFSDFEKVKQPQEIKGVTELLRRIARAEGERKIVILTARGTYKPVKDYLEDIGLRDIYVVALNSADPQDKANWIEQKIKEGYNDVFFIDDSHKNVQAVQALEKKYPDIKLQVRHVQHNIPNPPKETNEIKLKSLLPNKL